ncbi:hypothetical protein QFZ63_001378 [Streptomyces sp. B3I7]|nr:hypothetical protein [Streptomyces sp. B3I7]
MWTTFAWHIHDHSDDRIPGNANSVSAARDGSFADVPGPGIRGQPEKGRGRPAPAPSQRGAAGRPRPPSLAYSSPGVPVGPGGSGTQVCDHAMIAAMTGSRSCPLAVRRYRTCTGVSGTT